MDITPLRLVAAIAVSVALGELKSTAATRAEAAPIAAQKSSSPTALRASFWSA